MPDPVTAEESKGDSVRSETALARPSSPERDSKPRADAPSEAPNDCLQLGQLATDPRLSEVRRIMEEVSLAGNTNQSYRELSDKDLRSLVEQNDPDAMNALASNLRAQVSRDVETLSESDRIILEQAADLYYQASLRGKVWALLGYGAMQDRLHGGAVGLGWVDDEEFDTFDDRQKNAVSPSVVYAGLMLRSMPQLYATPMGMRFVYRLPANDERFDALVDQVEKQFNEDLAAQYLPPVQDRIDLPELDYHDIYSDYCDYESSVIAGWMDRSTRSR